MSITFVVVGSSPWASSAADDSGFAFAQEVAQRLGGAYHVIVPAGQGASGVESSECFHLHRVSTGGRVRTVLRLRRELRLVLRGLNRDVVTSASDPLAFLACLGVGSEPRHRLLVQVQGEVLSPGPEYGSLGWRLLIRTITRWSVRRADAVRALNNHIATSLREITPKPIYTVGTRVDSTKFFTEVGPRSDLAVVSSLVPRKNLATVIRAWAGLGHGRSGHLLRIVGDGPDRARLEALTQQLGLASVVHFHGRLSASDVARTLSRSWSLVHPSLSEGQPRAVLEGLASGLPVVASAIPAHRELGLEVSGAGWLVSADDVPAWTRTLGHVCALSGAAHRRASSCARQLAVTRFDIARNADEFAAMIKRTHARTP